MNTPATSRSRWLRIGIMVGLIMLVQGALAYLLTWIDVAPTPAFVQIRIASYPAWSVPQPKDAVSATRDEIRQTLDDLANRRANEPTIVYLSGIAFPTEAGVVVVPSDGTAADAASWLPLREVLEKFKECPSKQKLLVFEWTPPPVLDRVGYVYHDVAALLPDELEAVPDADRLVLSACSPNERPHVSAELGQSVFAHYFQQALGGREGRVSTSELAAFVKTRVDRWAIHNRGERQTPMLLGTGPEFSIARIESFGAADVPKQTKYAGPLQDWQSRDRDYRAGVFRDSPRHFQWRQASYLRSEQTDRESERHMVKRPRPASVAQVRPPEQKWGATKKMLDERRAQLDQQLLAANPTEAEHIKKRFIQEMVGKIVEPEREEIVFAHLLTDTRLEPGTFRLFNGIIDSAPAVVPTNPQGLCLRQIADLAMRTEVQAWPRDLVEAVLRAADAGERAMSRTPHLPGYVSLLDEPVQDRHAGEIRVWTGGYASPHDARRLLTGSAEKLERLIKLNDRWDRAARTLDEAYAELPWYLEALETMQELREPWRKATDAARGLADILEKKQRAPDVWLDRVAELDEQITAAEPIVQRLQTQRQALHAPFAKDAIVRLEGRCQAQNADASVRQTAAALLSAAGPVLTADDRVILWNAVSALSRRLNDETLAMDRQDDEAGRAPDLPAPKLPQARDELQRATLRARWHLALFELAGVSDLRCGPLRGAIDKQQTAAKMCATGAIVHEITHKGMQAQWAQEIDWPWNLKPNWRAKERLAWVMPPLLFREELDNAEISRTQRQQMNDFSQFLAWRWQLKGYLEREYKNLNLESPGIAAARSYYAPPEPGSTCRPMPPRDSNGYVQMKVIQAAEPLTEKQPYSQLSLEITRHIPPGAFGPLELRVHRPDDVWLDVSPDAMSLPASIATKEPRTLRNVVPIKVVRMPNAERKGLSAPLGFLVEAKFEGRSYHQLVKVPIVPSSQELQILVSADPDEPTSTTNEVRVRPGKVKQPHYVYVKNLTNRTQKVHVEVRSGDTVVSKTDKVLNVDADGVRKVVFADAAPTGELRGPLTIRVLDAEHVKVLHEQVVRVEIMPPAEYVQVAQAVFEPGREGNNKWAVEVQASRSVAGPAIAAQLVLPIQHIPGLQSIGGGTMLVELPTQSKAPRTLFAENLRLLPAAPEEGPVYLHIDGVPRVFVYRTTFSRGGEPNQPRPDDRPAIRLAAPQAVRAGVNCVLDVEVDNAPPGSKLDVVLGRILDDLSFRPEITREFGEAKKRRIDLAASKDALIFDATISDWTATFDTTSIVGPREMRARILDSAGRVIAQSGQSLVIDDSPPIARMAPTPAQVKKGTMLQVQAQGVDPESGVAQVIFFFGKAEKGEIPRAAPRFKGVPTNRENTHWFATLDVPANHKGPLAVSVQVVNHAGMATIDTVSFDVTDHEPGKTGLGEIRGKVIEGQRPQPNLNVTLLDERGKEVARTSTNADGSYVFQLLAPGRYRVVCVKPESQRRAVLDVSVEPDRMARADLALAL